MTTIIGISGSLRRGLFNSGLQGAAAELMPAGAELKIESIEGIPLYNGDVEASFIDHEQDQISTPFEGAEFK